MSLHEYGHNDFFERGKFFLKAALCHVSLLILLLLDLVPLTPLGIEHTPYFFITGLYFYSIFRPNRLPIWQVFVYGLITDVVRLNMIGFFALTYTLVAYFIRKHRRRVLSQPFPILWAGFSLIVFVFFLFQYVYMNVTHENVLISSDDFIQLGLTMIFFPLIYLALSIQNRYLDK